MGILEDIESGIGLAPAPSADVPAPLLEDPLYSGANGVDAAMPMGSAAQAAAQDLAWQQGTDLSGSVVPALTPYAAAPGWTTLNIQQDLNRLGALPKLVEDGKAGPKTTAALKAFQKSKGLVGDGKIGPKTEAAITAALAGPPSPFVVPAPAPAASSPTSPAPAPAPKAAALDPLLGGKPPAPKPASSPAKAAVAAGKPTNVKAVLGVGVGVLGAIALAIKAHVFGGR